VKYLICAIMLLVAVTAFADKPTPKGLESSISFADATTPYKIRIAQRERGLGWAPAQFIQLAANDSLRVVVVNSNTDPKYYGPGEYWLEGIYDAEVDRNLRYTPGGPKLSFEGPAHELWLYGPADGSYPNSVSVNIWCEY
jgi:hypothetical protein